MRTTRGRAVPNSDTPTHTRSTHAQKTQVPYQALLAVGYTVDAVAPGKSFPGSVKTAVHDFEGDATYTEKPGHAFALTRGWGDGMEAEYDILYLPGGRMPEYARLDAGVARLVSAFLADPGKIIVSVCHGAQLLTAAAAAAGDGGGLKGRRLTAYPACGPECRLAGAAWEDAAPDAAVVDEGGPGRGATLISSPAWPGHPAVLAALFKAAGTAITHKE
jgi:protease I